MPGSVMDTSNRLDNQSIKSTRSNYAVSKNPTQMMRSDFIVEDLMRLTIFNSKRNQQPVEQYMTLNDSIYSNGNFSHRESILDSAGRGFSSMRGLRKSRRKSSNMDCSNLTMTGSIKGLKSHSKTLTTSQNSSDFSFFLGARKNSSSSVISKSDVSTSIRRKCSIDQICDAFETTLSENKLTHIPVNLKKITEDPCGEKIDTEALENDIVDTKAQIKVNESQKPDNSEGKTEKLVSASPPSENIRSRPSETKEKSEEAPLPNIDPSKAVSSTVKA